MSSVRSPKNSCVLPKIAKSTNRNDLTVLASSRLFPFVIYDVIFIRTAETRYSKPLLSSLVSAKEMPNTDRVVENVNNRKFTPIAHQISTSPSQPNYSIPQNRGILDFRFGEIKSTPPPITTPPPPRQIGPSHGELWAVT